MSSPQSADESREEIRDLVAAGDVGRALRRLLDFARDFTPGRELENEAVNLSARLHILRRDARRAGSSPEVDAKQGVLVGNLLDLVDEIHSRSEVVKAPALQVVRPVEIAKTPDTPPAPVARPETAPPDAPTRLEQAKLVFKRRREELEAGAAVPAFRCRGLGKTYRGRGGFELADLNLELRPGEITGLIGVNGAGKTTILRMIAAELRSSRGTVSYPLFESTAGRHDWAAIRHKIAYVEQAPRQWYGPLAETLHLAAAVHGLRGRENEDEVEFILQRLGLDEYRDHLWNEISGGFKMRFELARALVTRPQLLVLDEPLAPLDVLTQQLFLQDLRDLANSVRNPLPIIVSSQHLYEIESIADQILFLNGGKAVYCGRLADLAGDRVDNLFEVSVGASRSLLEERLMGVKVLDIEEFGPTYHIRVPRSTSGADLLRVLVSSGIDVTYFRDISRSTRRLFDSKLDSL